MKKILLPLLALPLFCLIFAGCEWSSSNSNDNLTGAASTWNDRENFVDFSGSYKASDGGVLVRQSGAGSGSSTNITITTNSVSGEVLGTGNGSSTAFSGVLAHVPMPHTFTIVVGGYRFSDAGSGTAGTVNLTVTPADGSSGTLNLDTGAWAVSFPSPIVSGTQLIGAYTYLSRTEVVTPNQGNHGSPIYSFVIYQQGNTIEIIDNCGSIYNGSIGSVRNTGGTPVDLNPANPTAAALSVGPVVAQLYAKGTSQGFSVEIVGVLQGTLTTASTFANRNIKATFIEQGGYSSDISGEAQ